MTEEAKVTVEVEVEQYEIIIKRTLRKKLVKRIHTVIDERPYTDEELDEGNQYWRGSKAERGEKYLKQVQGWSEPVDAEETKEDEVYRQTVDTLDMVAVINAINGATPA